MSTAWSLTVGGVSNPWPLAEPSCLGTGIIDPETGTETGGPEGGVYTSVATAVVGVRSTSTTWSGERLRSTRMFQRNVGEKNWLLTL